MKKFLDLKLFLHLFVLFVIWKMKPLYTFFLFLQPNKISLSKLRELLKSEIRLQQNTAQCAFFDFPGNKKIFEIINHLYLIFKYHLFKFRNTRKISKEGLKKNITKIYNIEKQICFKDSKKKKVFKKLEYTEKNFKMNEFYRKSCLGGG